MSLMQLNVEEIRDDQSLLKVPNSKLLVQAALLCSKLQGQRYSGRTRSDLILLGDIRIGVFQDKDHKLRAK